MKWLIFFPAWVFLLSYVIYKMREPKGADSQDPVQGAASPAAELATARKGGAEHEPLSLIHISEPTRLESKSRMPACAW